ncbi:MAG: hypothetical protein ACYC4L_22310 [Chloroflexota bacterium]
MRAPLSGRPVLATARQVFGCGRQAALLQLGVMGLAALLLYGLLAWRFPLLVLHRSRSGDLGYLTERSYLAAALIVLALVTLFLLQGLAARRAAALGDDRRALGLVLAVAALAGVVAVLVYPIGSTDVFNYIFQGRVLALHGDNPYLVVPRSYAKDAMAPSVPWGDWPSTYGPLWLFVSAAAGRIYREDILLGLLAYEAVAVAFYLGTAVLVYAAVRAYRPAWAVAAALLFAWNPLVVYETAVNRHNDIAMAFFATAALLAYRRGRLALALPLLMASVLVKFMTVLLLPLFLAHWLSPREQRRRRLGQAFWGLLVAGLLAVAFYAPFWYGLATLDPVLRRADLFTSTPAAVVVAWLKVNGLGSWQATVPVVCTMLLALFVLWRAYTLWRGNASLATAAFDVLFASLLLSFWFQPWYIVTAVPFAFASGEARPRRMMLALSAGAALSYVVFGYVGFWLPREYARLPLQILAAATIFGPPLAVYAWPRWRAWYERQTRPPSPQRALRFG